MDKKAILVLILIVITSLILSGCGSKQCESKTDCPAQGVCKISSCVKGQCVYTTKAGCTCGDDVCDDAKENACSCPTDCKVINPCEGDVDDYLKNYCDDKQRCVTTTKTVPKQQTSPENMEITDYGQKIAKLTGTYVYDEPFNTESSTLSLSLKIETKDPLIRNVIINKIKVVSHSGTRNEYSKLWENDEEKTIGEEELKRTLWDDDAILITTIPLLINDLNGTQPTNIGIKYDIQYIMRDSLGKDVTKSFEYEKVLSLILIKTTEEKKCPSVKEWDDNNPCTTETCSESTKYFIKRTTKLGCAGNYICETGENGCNAPLDCEPCTGDVGSYLEKTCMNGCKTRIKSGIQINSQPVIQTTNAGPSMFDVTVALNRPFNAKKDSFRVRFELTKPGTATGMTITKVQVIDVSQQQVLLAEQSTNLQFTGVGSLQTTELGLISPIITSIYGESKKNPILKIAYTYTDTMGGAEPIQTQGDFQVSLGEITFINPDVQT